ncbi:MULTISPECIES: hypothetical protein [unclassified Microbispora]|uniref:hypothetical protein n=1 Tax=unclassified Microbispora TaxID=2614687 RepID=UPI00147455E8|nr:MULTISPECIES: hypothetical protein [unclassified Microbispora]
MRRPIRLLSLAALTCAGLLATAPAYAACGCDAPKAATKPTAALGVDAGLNLGLGLGLAVDLNVGLDLNAQAGVGAGTTSCGTPRVVRACR